MRVIAVLNQTAGTIEREGIEAFRAGLAQAFAACGVAAELEFLTGEAFRRGAQQAVARAAAHEVDAVVVGGGDGSIRTLAGMAAGTGVALGVLPLGTLNHFARDLGIPLAVDEAVAVIAAAHERLVDVAEVNGRVFINNSSIGIYPYMVADRERRRRLDGRSKWIAMAFAFLRMIRRFPLRRLAVRAEGASAPYRTPCLFIANNEYGIDLLGSGKRQTLDGGMLWVYVVKERNPLSFLWLACRLCLGVGDRERDLDAMRVRSAEIISPTSRLLVALDGEIETLAPPLRYRTRPRALKVFAPAPTPAQS